MRASETRQVAKYLFVGASSAVLELMIFKVLIELFPLPLAIGNVIAVVIATAYNYALNKRWSFDSKTWSSRSAVLYAMLFAFNTIFSSTFITISHALGFAPVIAKIVSMGCIVVWNYFLYKNVVFK